MDGGAEAVDADEAEDGFVDDAEEGFDGGPGRRRSRGTARSTERLMYRARLRGSPWRGRRCRSRRCGRGPCGRGWLRGGREGAGGGEFGAEAEGVVGEVALARNIDWLPGKRRTLWRTWSGRGFGRRGRGRRWRGRC
jgi:hypothetical protein